MPRTSGPEQATSTSLSTSLEYCWVFTGSLYSNAETGLREPSWSRTASTCTSSMPLAGATTLYHVVATVPDLVLGKSTTGAASSDAIVANTLESVRVAREAVPVPVKEMVGRATTRSLAGGAAQLRREKAWKGNRRKAEGRKMRPSAQAPTGYKISMTWRKHDTTPHGVTHLHSKVNMHDAPHATKNKPGAGAMLPCKRHPAHTHLHVVTRQSMQLFTATCVPHYRSHVPPADHCKEKGPAVSTAMA